MNDEFYKKLLYIVILIMIGLFFLGKNLEIQATSNPTPDMITIANDRKSDYHYVVDKKTNVVYVECSAGMTVMVNADGTPITADQLGIEP